MNSMHQLRSKGGVLEDNPAAAAKARPKRQVFGDVSNNGKKEQSSQVLEKEQQPARRTTRATKTQNKSRSKSQTRRAALRKNSARQQPKSKRSVGSGKRATLAKRQSTMSRAALKSSNSAASRPFKSSSKKRSRSRSRSRSSDHQPATKKSKRSTHVKLDNSKKSEARATKRNDAKKQVLTKSRGRSNTSRVARRKQAAPSIDFVPGTDYSMVRRPFDASKYTAGIAQYDEHNKSNEFEVSNYVTDIYQRLYDAETHYRPELYMKKQKNINIIMRAILIDWLAEVHTKFRLVPSTLYLTVNILDRYCSQVAVERNNLQCIGIACLLLACKYEEIYPPAVRDCVYMTDRAYTRQQVLDVEQDILTKLDFKLTSPTAYPFLTRFLLVTEASALTKHAANYYLERTLQDYVFIKFRPSLTAAAAVCLALNNPDVRKLDQSGKGPGVPKVLLEYTKFKKSDIIDVAELVAEKVEEEVITKDRDLLYVKKKYKGGKYKKVARVIRNPDAAHILAP